MGTTPQIAIVGGGLVGLAFANLLAVRRPELAAGITVVERQAPGEVEAEIGLRVSAWSPAAVRMFDECGVWPRLAPDRIAPYRRMVVWRGADPAGPESLSFDAAEQGIPALGYIVDNDRLRALLWARAEDLGLRLRTGASPESIAVEPTGVAVTFDSGPVLSCQLLVGADGQASWVRAAAGIESWQWQYPQRGVVAHFAPAGSHRDTAWQRFLPAGPLALLPLADGRVSMVWSCPPAEAEELAAAGPAALGEAVTAASGAILGPLEATTQAAAFPLRGAHARHYIKGRVALIGDAAHQVHPLAGLGANLGLRDAEQLAAELAAFLDRPGADPGDLRVLRRYERSRKADNLATLATTDLLHRAFSEGWETVASMAGHGLGLVDRLPPLKRVFAAAAAGQGG